jgi:hypothetical protein
VRILKGAKTRAWITRMLHRSANPGKRQTRPPLSPLMLRYTSLSQKLAQSTANTIASDMRAALMEWDSL